VVQLYVPTISLKLKYIKMKSLSSMIAIMLLSTTIAFAQFNNSKTETVKVYGNCEMCKAKIEKAGAQKNVSNVVWSEETNLATITYDAKKTTTDAILKKIALAGYDSDNFLAPDAVYKKLPGCCKYERVKKPIAKTTAAIVKEDKIPVGDNTHPIQIVNEIQIVLDNYFALKDALVKTDAATATANAATLLTSLNAINMGKMKMDDHMAFMKVEKALKADASTISTSKDIAVQRTAFSNLSSNMIALIKVAKANEAVYLQHCPMANGGKGADWLSKENAVKNPYYGNMMLTCGKTVETIK
jgi:copper chaperone CopZ